MKVKLFTTLALLAIVAAVVAPSGAFAQAYSTSFTTSITYQNVGTADANVSILFYASPDSTTPIEVTRPTLAPGAGTSLYIGALSDISAGFKGSAIMQSDQPLLATLVQLPQGSTTVKNRPLSNGFSDGTDQTLIATVLKNQFETNTIFSVQNVGSAATDVTMHFYNTSASEVYTANDTIQPGAATYIDAGAEAGLPSPFNGSVVVEAANSTDKIVASAMELSTTGTAASAFEGVGSGATTFYMPSALCEAFGANTAYAVQNTSLSNSTQVTVTYSNSATETKTIGPGAKQSFIACQASGMSPGFSGAATVESDTTPVIAIGKAYGSGLSTAFVGASSGASELALPYVRWASDANYANGSQQRTFITVQNIGSSDLAAGDVSVDYVDKNGVVVGTHNLSAIPAGGKVNSNASLAGLSEFGVYPDGSFGGGAIVTGPSGSELAVVGRVSTQLAPGSFASEDYNGMEVPAP
jgi:hypothetical protein